MRKIWKESFYFNKGITYSASGSKGPSFRFLPNNHIFDIGGASIFPKSEFTEDLNYFLSFLNSKLATYLINCLNPTVKCSKWRFKTSTIHFKCR